MKDPDGAGYPATFNVDGSHDLTKVARFESYRGFLFGSLNPDVRAADEHLGDTTKVIDMLVDQSPEGLEVLRGSSTYTYDGNWKVQAENGADGYHVTATHWNYAATTSRRSTGESKNDTKALDAGSWGKSGGGYWSYPNGHLCLWTWAGQPARTGRCGTRSTNSSEQVRRRARASSWSGFPQPVPVPERLPDGPVLTQIRHFRPIAVGQDRSHHLLHRAEGRERREARAHRIRQYEDFFNASGMATPDDLEEFRSCQLTYPGAGSTVERHEPGRRALDDGPATQPPTSACSRVLERRQDRRRRPVHGPARLLAATP